MKHHILLEDNIGGSMVSPLVDVVMNLMITFFVFLMIYMTVVVPVKNKDIDPPIFVESTTKAP